MQDLNNTQYFKVQKEPQMKVKDVIKLVYHALSEKGYNPVNQMVGYIMSGDPTYITSYDDARTKLRRHERYELIEELVISYLKNIKK